MTLQTILVERIKRKIKKNETIGGVLGNLLGISPDAVYRRTRGETHFSLYELEIISNHFNISIDDLFNRTQKNVSFDYQPIDNEAFSMTNYLRDIRNSLRVLQNQEHPKLLLTINNTHFFQLFNFPELIKFKLFFWAKTHLQLQEYQTIQFSEFEFSAEETALGDEILSIYTTIPSTELYDPDLMRGFAREIYFYYSSQELDEPKKVVEMYNECIEFINHLKQQAKIGKKYCRGTSSLKTGNKLELYYNESLNSIASFYYETKQTKGLFLAHNFMNSLHTLDENYVNDTKNVLDQLISNSSKISVVATKERNHYFSEIEKVIKSYCAKVKLDVK